MASLDSAGSKLELRPSAVKVAPVVGFVAPELAAPLLSGATYRLSEDRGRIVIVEFWSVDCLPSERARPALNALAARLPADRFRWVAMARESNRGLVQPHLDSLPMNATVLLNDSLSWVRYNPDFSTPLFYVIDADGIVRFRARGVSTVNAVSAKVAELLNAAAVRGARP
jgi:thiol-disulfide isomerase/thioredoxin